MLRKRWQTSNSCFKESLSKRSKLDYLSAPFRIFPKGIATFARESKCTAWTAASPWQICLAMAKLAYRQRRVHNNVRWVRWFWCPVISTWLPHDLRWFPRVFNVLITSCLWFIRKQRLCMRSGMGSGKTWSRTDFIRSGMGSGETCAQRNANDNVTWCHDTNCPGVSPGLCHG